MSFSVHHVFNILSPFLWYYIFLTVWVKLSEAWGQDIKHKKIKISDYDSKNKILFTVETESGNCCGKWSFFVV